MRSFFGFLMIACGLIAYAGYYFQGPAATLVVLSTWVSKYLDRGQPDTSLGLLRRMSLWMALGITTLAMLLDWILYVEDVWKPGQSESESAARAYDSPDLLPNTVATLCAFGIALTLVGKGKGWWRTLGTAVLLLGGSFAISFLRSCHGISM